MKRPALVVTGRALDEPQKARRAIAVVACGHGPFYGSSRAAADRAARAHLVTHDAVQLPLWDAS